MVNTGGAERHPGDTERLMTYWAEGPGAAKIAWNSPGDFDRCVVELGKYVSPGIVKGLCSNLHQRATGARPGHAPGDKAGLTMFAGVISRDNGTPWPATGMTSATWLHISTTTVPIAALTATQPGVLLAALTSHATPVGGDPAPHVIQWQDRMYLEDGHHRVIRALIAGHDTITARILNLDT